MKKLPRVSGDLVITISIELVLELQLIPLAFLYVFLCCVLLAGEYVYGIATTRHANPSTWNLHLSHPPLV